MAESETRPVLGGGAVQQAKAKSLFHVRLRVTGLQADGQAAAQAEERTSIQGGGEGYKRREGKCTGCWRRNRME